MSDIMAHYRNGAILLNDYDRMRSFLRDLDYTPEPGDPVIWKTMGNIFFLERKYDQALKCYINSVEIDHYYPDALNNIGMTYKILGQDDKAEKIFDFLASVRNQKAAGDLKNSGYFLTNSVKKPRRLRYRIIEDKIGMPLWTYGFAAVFLIYGAAANRMIGGILWALLVLGIGYIIMRIRLKFKKDYRIRFISASPVIPGVDYGKSPFISRIFGKSEK